jgi:hypothetical protein
MAEIKDIVIEEAAEYGDVPGGGHPSLPGSAYPGHSVGYPTCSEPSRTNRGCDAWNKCGTKGEGPYTVMFQNPKGRKSATHCRNWMYKLQFKQALGYRAIDDEWMECMESVAEDPTDIKKGTKLKTYKMKVEGVRMPYPEVRKESSRSGDSRKEGTEKGAEARVGSDGDGKGRTRAKRSSKGSV